MSGFGLALLSILGCQRNDPPKIPARPPTDIVSTEIVSTEIVSTEIVSTGPATAADAGQSSASSNPSQPLAATNNPATNQSAPIAVATSIRFEDVAEAMGLRFTYDNGEKGQVLMVETMGGGCGWLDLDRDGRYDLVVNQGGSPVASPQHGQSSDEIFQNLGDHFRAIATWARFDELSYSQAIAVGDMDNDGFEDVYVSNVFENTLWHNLGDGTFVEVGVQAGVADPRWSSSAAWADLDRDGDLDLYVCNYVQYDPRKPVPCNDGKGQIAVCNPATLEPWPDACFINQGDGTFQDQATSLGLTGPNNRALGVAVCDFDRDGWPDVYVANDTTPNFLFQRNADGRYKDMASIMGCDVDRVGAPQASMGIAVADIDRNGYQDMYITNYYEESNTLYANFGANGFQDQTAILGLHQPTLAFLGFGTAAHDFDSDGNIDLFVANGHVDSGPANQANLKMVPQLFVRNGKRFYSVGPQASPYFQNKKLGRGVAMNDFDNDGDIDLAVVHQNDPLTLLKNVSIRGEHRSTISISLIGTISNRQGIGCRVGVTQNSDTQFQELCGGTSFASTHQPKLIFPVDGQSTSNVEVHWPSGRSQRLQNVAPGSQLVCKEPIQP